MGERRGTQFKSKKMGEKPISITGRAIHASSDGIKGNGGRGGGGRFDKKENY